MTENKRYYIGNGKNCTICDNNQGGSDFYNMLTQFEAVDRLNEQEELINRLKEIREEQIETILKQKRKIKELTTQLQTEEDDVCIKCKHHYLTKKDPLHDAISNGEIVPFSSSLIDIEPYYISKCKKGHVECSKEDIRYCEDFELDGDVE